MTVCFLQLFRLVDYLIIFSTICPEVVLGCSSICHQPVHTKNYCSKLKKKRKEENISDKIIFITFN